MLNSKYLASRYLFIIFITLAFLPASDVFAQDITTGLVGHWKFDETTGTIASDSSGNSNTGTLTNGPTWTTGKIGNAVSIDGSSYVSVSSALDVAALPFSLSLWVNPANFNDYGTLMGKRTTYSTSGMRFNLDLNKGNGTVLFQSASSNLNFTYAPSLNQWTLLTVVVRSGATDLYVNGTLNQTLGGFTLGTGSTAQVRMGNAADGPDQYAGSLDDVRIYTRALAAADVQALYSLGTVPDTQAPSVPTNLSATTQSSTQINLSWTASTDNVGVTGYRVYRGGVQIASPSTTFYSDTGLSPSTTYFYTIAAVDAAGNISSQSTSAQATTQAPPPPDTQAPTAPTNLTATAQSSSQINLSWTASTDNIGVMGYRVERCQGSGCSTFVQIATPSTNSYSNTGLTASTAYTYRVRAVDAALNLSGYSANISATTQAPPPPDTTPPSVPTNLSATPQSSSQINISWTASTDNVGVTGYRVERCTGSTCTTFSQIATPSTNSYNDTGLTANTTYRYRVRATDAVPNLSGYSSVVSATTQSAPPPSQNNMYFNSSEPGCDGSNANYVFCDDFEDGTWYEKDCDQANFSGGLLQTDGWCGSIYANPITPAGAAVCGGLGVVGTNCSATSGYKNGSIGARNAALHGFNNDLNYDEVYLRWYQKPLAGFVPGHEKIMTFQQNIYGGFQCCMFMFPFGNLEPDLQTQNAATARLYQNLGNALSVIPGHWYYFEVHLKLNTAGGSDGIFDFWMDDCGTNGLGCTGSGTQRARWTNRNDLRDTNPASRIGAIWLGNWANPGSTGEEYYDQMVVSTTRIGPMGSTPPPPDTTYPTVSLTAPSNGSTVSGSSVTISANASDNIGVSGVQFLLDGANLNSEDTASPYSISWNTTTATNGSHTLSARARDAAGNTTTSSSVTVTVDNGPLVGDLNQDRTVNGADWTIMAEVWFTADAVADINKDGIVNSIDFSLMNANWGRTI